MTLRPQLNLALQVYGATESCNKSYWSWGAFLKIRYKLQTRAPLHQVANGSELKASLHKGGGSLAYLRERSLKCQASTSSRSWEEPAWLFLKAAVVTLLFRGAVHVLQCRFASVLPLLIGWQMVAWELRQKRVKALPLVKVSFHPLKSNISPLSDYLSKCTFQFLGDCWNGKRTLSNIDTAAVCRALGVHASLHIWLLEWRNFHAFTHMETIISHHRWRSPVINIQKKVV